MLMLLVLYTCVSLSMYGRTYICQRTSIRIGRGGKYDAEQDKRMEEIKRELAARGVRIITILG